MGYTKIKATIDDNTISCDYYHFFESGDDTAKADINVKVYHRYINDLNIVNSIKLEEFYIVKKYLTTTGLLDLSDQVTQTASFTIMNLRYVQDLFIEISEVREGVPLVTTVDILDGNDEWVEPLPSNPVKEPEFEENIPEHKAESPDDNISTPEDSIVPIVYLYSSDDLLLYQASRRIFLVVDEEDNQTFKAQDYNQRVKPVYIENSITNLLPNPSFTELEGKQPKYYTVDAPAIIVNSALLEDDELVDTNVWQLKFTNSNIFNAFNSAIISHTEKRDLYAGVNNLTISYYYKLLSDILPFDAFKVRVGFYDLAGDFISSVDKVIAPVKGDTWQLVYGSFKSAEIPVTARQFETELELFNINDANQFTVHLYLPQAETSPFPTTRTLDVKVQDVYKTSKPIDLQLPLYVSLQTRHMVGSGIRGLFSTTISQVDGVQFLASSDRIRLKQWDANGNLIFNISSNTFNIAENAITTYGVYISDSAVEFYLNGVMLNSIAGAYALDQTAISAIVGGLESSNTNINSDLIDFRILKLRP